jgi:hypothetical protein
VNPKDLRKVTDTCAKPTSSSPESGWLRILALVRDVRTCEGRHGPAAGGRHAGTRSLTRDGEEKGEDDQSANEESEETRPEHAVVVLRRIELGKLNLSVVVAGVMMACVIACSTMVHGCPSPHVWGLPRVASVLFGGQSRCGAVTDR